jgi:hypothetical protein
MFSGALLIPFEPIGHLRFVTLRARPIVADRTMLHHRPADDVTAASVVVDAEVNV